MFRNSLCTTGLLHLLYLLLELVEQLSSVLGVLLKFRIVAIYVSFNNCHKCSTFLSTAMIGNTALHCFASLLCHFQHSTAHRARQVSAFLSNCEDGSVSNQCRGNKKSTMN